MVWARSLAGLVLLTVVALIDASLEVTASIDQEIQEEGFTTSLTIECSIWFSDKLDKVGSIALNHISDGNGQATSVSSVTRTTGPSLKPNTGAASVKGFVGSNDKVHFLETKWIYPDERLSGLFECEIHGSDGNGNFVTLRDSKRVNITNVPKERLYKVISKLKSDVRVKDDSIGKLTEIIKTGSASINAKDELIDSLEATIQSKDAAIQQLHVAIQNKDETIKTSEAKLNMLESRCPLRSCEDFDGDRSTEKVVNITLKDHTSFPVKCSVDHSGRKWTVFQNRFDGSQSFYKSFTDYDKGFGDLNGEFWLGLSKIQALMEVGKKYQLRVEVEGIKGRSLTRLYRTFELGPAPGYVLTVDDSDQEDSALLKHSGRPFRAPGNPDDDGCAESYQSGWWFTSCSFVNLNAPYKPLQGGDRYHHYNMNSYDFGQGKLLAKTRMLFREVA